MSFNLVSNVGTENVAALVDGSVQVSVSSKKPEKRASFAYAVAFADSASRKDQALAIYANQLRNGQYRPLMGDIVSVLVPKAAQSWVMASLPQQGPVSKEAFAQLCIKIDAAVRADAAKKEKPVGDYLKGSKAFMFGIVSHIVNIVTVVEAEKAAEPTDTDAQ